MKPLGSLFKTNFLGFGVRAVGSPALILSTKYLESSGGNYKWLPSTATCQALDGKNVLTIEMEVFQIQSELSVGLDLPIGGEWKIGYAGNFYLDYVDRIGLPQSALDGSSLNPITGWHNDTQVEVLTNSANWGISHYLSSTFASPVWLKIAMVMESDGTTKSIYLYDPQLDELVFEGFALNRDNIPNSVGKALTIGSNSGNSQFHSGGISFVRVWDKALTKAEVLANFRKGINRLDSDLLVNIELEEGSGYPKDIINDVPASSVTNSGNIAWKTYPAPVPSSLSQSTKYLEFDGGNYKWLPSTSTCQALDGKSEVTVEMEVFQTQRQGAAGLKLPNGHFWHVGFDNGGTDFFFLDWGDRLNLPQSVLDGSSLNTLSGGQNATPVEVLTNSANWGISRYVSSTFASPVWLKIAMVMESDGTTKTVYIFDPALDELVFEGFTENRNNTPNAVNNALTIGSDSNDTKYHTGGISYVRVWDKALTKSEVLANFSNGINRLDSDLLVNIELEEGSGYPKDIINDVPASSVTNSGNIAWKTY
jgi:hypothetical protein